MVFKHGTKLSAFANQSLSKYVLNQTEEEEEEEEEEHCPTNMSCMGKTLPAAVTTSDSTTPGETDVINDRS